MENYSAIKNNEFTMKYYSLIKNIESMKFLGKWMEIEISS